MTIGELRLTHRAADVEILLADPSDSVRAAAIYAMHACGRPVDRTPLAAMLTAPDPEVRGNVIWILGKMGDPSALPMLQEASRPHAGAVTLRDRLIGLQLVRY